MKKYLIIGALFVVILVASFLAFGNNHKVDTPRVATQGTYVALGDSVAAGVGLQYDSDSSACDRTNQAYPDVVAKRLNYKLSNVACSGATLPQGITGKQDVNELLVSPQLQQLFSMPKPKLITITIGANDAIRGLDVATIEANIRTAVKKLQDNGSEVILGGMQIYDNLGSDYVKSFSAIYPRVANDMNIPLIPFFLDGVGGDPELNQSDAIHPTDAGYTIIVNNNILPILQPEIEQLLLAKANLPAPIATPTETTQ